MAFTGPEEVTKPMQSRQCVCLCCCHQQKSNSLLDTRHSSPYKAEAKRTHLVCRVNFYLYSNDSQTKVTSRNTSRSRSTLFYHTAWISFNCISENRCKGHQRGRTPHSHSCPGSADIYIYTCCRPTSTLQTWWGTEPAELAGAGIKCESGHRSRWTDSHRRRGGCETPSGLIHSGPRLELCEMLYIHSTKQGNCRINI